MNRPSRPDRRLVVGISGASGVIYGARLLQLLRNTDVETHLVMTKAAEVTFAHETSTKIAEVKALGAATGSTRTADQTQIGQFWNPPIWATWNRIAETTTLAHDGRVEDDARTFAALNLTFADAVIAFYDAKYAYHVWRPVTAIRATSDPNWTPLSNTAPDPSYPGAHGAISAAAADVLASTYGNRFGFTVDSTALPGVTREFTSFSEASEEASESRIFNGNHTRVDQVAGENLGHDVADLVLKSFARGRP